MEKTMKLKLLTLGGASLLLAGCVTTTDPVSMGGGRYMITLNARGGFQSNGTLITETVQRANNFCATQGKSANVLSTETKGVQMWTPPNNRVVFECVSPSP